MDVNDVMLIYTGMITQELKMIHNPNIFDRFDCKALTMSDRWKNRSAEESTEAVHKLALNNSFNVFWVNSTTVLLNFIPDSKWVDDSWYDVF